MMRIKPLIKSFFGFVRRRDSLIYVVILVSVLALTGWQTGNVRLNAYFPAFIPIPHFLSLIFIVLGIYLLVRKSYWRPEIDLLSIVFLVFITILCLYLFLNYFFKFTGDIERIFIANPARLNNFTTDRTSPISSILLVMLCTGLWGQRASKHKLSSYIGFYSSLIAFLVSMIILIGYLYESPLLYGSNIIPVSLPSGINIFLFSLTLLRYYDFKLWIFNNLQLDNKFTKLLIKSFLPTALLLILIDGFLDARAHIYNSNPTLKSTITLFVIITIAAILIIRLSTQIGNELLAKEKKLKESESKFRTVAEYTYAWEFWLDNDGKFIYNSPSCERITGYDRNDFFQNPELMTQIIYPDDLSVYLSHIKEKNSGPCDGLDYRIISRSGEVRWITHVCQPVFDEYDSVIGRRGSARDITERVCAVNQVRELNKKLTILNSDKDRFISILGHDLKSPFNNILGITELLKEEFNELSSTQIKNFIVDLNKSAKLTNNLLEDILMWVRSQQGQMAYNPKKINISRSCSNIIDVLNPAAYAKNITIHQAIDEKMNVYADSAMLKTIMLNLISNAIKFTRPGGRVNIYADECADVVTITVSDTGIGISAENIARLFDITQVISTKGTARETGTGLGLLLCKDFIEKHGGKIWVNSEVEKGSNFSFTIPVQNVQIA